MSENKEPMEETKVVSEEEIKQVEQEVLAKEQEKEAVMGNFQDDEMFDTAVKMVLDMQHASVSVLQRRLRLGYARAARLIDMMEEKGIVGPFRGSKPREILVDRESFLASEEAAEEESQ